MLAINQQIHGSPVREIFFGGVSAKREKAAVAALWETETGKQAFVRNAEGDTVSHLILEGIGHVLQTFPADLDLAFFTNSSAVIEGHLSTKILNRLRQPMTRRTWPAKYFDQWIEINRAIKARKGRVRLSGQLEGSDGMMAFARSIARRVVRGPAMGSYELFEMD